MATQGPLSPATAADDATVGTVAWTNPTNATASDDVYSTVSNVNATTHYLKATNYGFSIPTNATIDGILVEVERKKVRASPLDNVVDSSIKIVKSSGAFGTTNKSAGASWSLTEGYVSFGGAADLWGETWSASDINSSNFGVGISASLALDSGITASIDYIRITVYYTSASPYTITADQGTFTLTGQASSFIYGRVLSAITGLFSLLGIDVNLRKYPNSSYTNQAKNVITPTNMTKQSSLTATNQSKHSITPTNSSKNASSATNQSKNTITPTNLTKN